MNKFEKAIKEVRELREHDEKRYQEEQEKSDSILRNSTITIFLIVSIKGKSYVKSYVPGHLF